jgi:hypothetical protein
MSVQEALLNRPVEGMDNELRLLHITDLRVLALLAWFRLSPCAFAHRDLPEQLGVLTGKLPIT